MSAIYFTNFEHFYDATYESKVGHIKNMLGEIT